MAVALRAILMLWAALAAPLGASFPRDVEWRLPFGCDFSGFFCEVALGFIPALSETPHFSPPLPNRLWLLKGACPSTFLEKLTVRERETIDRTMVEDDSRSVQDTAMSIAVEHGDPCRIRIFAERPHALVLRVMSEGKFPDDDISCISRSRADEIWVPTSFHAKQLRRQLFGANPSRMMKTQIHVVPEIVPSDFFSPTDRSNDL